MTVQSKNKCKPGLGTNKSNLPPPLRLAFTNIRGLRTNLADVEAFLLTNTPDILALSETNLHSSIPLTTLTYPDISHSAVRTLTDICTDLEFIFVTPSP